MREALGIDQPNWGTLWASQRLPDRVEADRFIHAKVEPEIVYVSGAPLAGRVEAGDVVAFTPTTDPASPLSLPGAAIASGTLSLSN
jgi:2-keto-4-pentenoate hydratase